MDRTLVLGGTGFLGRFLVEHLSREGVSVVSVARKPVAALVAGMRHFTIDVYQEPAALEQLIADVRPNCVVDLLGNRDQDHLAHLQLVHRLLTVLASRELKTTVLLTGSAAEYGHPVELPVDETHPLQPVTAYGLVRALQFWMVQRQPQQTGLRVLIARLFNVIGPGQPEGFVVGSIVRQAVAVEAGRRGAVDIGRIDAVRDFVDGRDVARALAFLAAHGRPGEAYNVCSGKPTSVEEVLQRVGRLCGLADAYYVVSVDRIRDDVPSIYGSFRKLEAETSWKPEIDLDHSLADMVAFERAAHYLGAPNA